MPHLQTQENWKEWKENFLTKLSKWSYYTADDEIEKGRSIVETALVEMMRKEVNEKYKEWHELLGKAEHEEKSNVVKICNERMNAYLDVMSLLSAHLQDIKEPR